MTCIAMQPLITSCCYEGMRMLHAVRPAQLRRPRDGAAGIRAAPEGRRCKEAAAAHPAATRQGTVVGWPPRRCGKMAGQAFLCILSFICKKKHLTQPQQRLQPRLPDIGFAGFSAEPSGAELCRITGYVMHSNLHLEAPRWTTCRKNLRVSCMYMLHLSCSLLQTRV